jgi:hypothetical protein
MEGGFMARAILGMLFSLILIAPFTGDLRAAQFKQCASVPPSCNTKAGGWKSAEFPHAVVNGCDYIENAFEGVSGQFLNFLSLPDLTPACNVHDRCYYSNGGKNADTCNRLFYEAMLGICAEKYDGLDLLDIARNRICATWVAEIAEAVHGMAESEANLPRARKSQEDYMKFIAKSCDLKTWDPYPCPGPKPGECRRQGDETCCRTKCVPSCSRGKSKWEWQCSK